MDNLIRTASTHSTRTYFLFGLAEAHIGWSHRSMPGLRLMADDDYDDDFDDEEEDEEDWEEEEDFDDNDEDWEEEEEDFDDDDDDFDDDFEEEDEDWIDDDDGDDYEFEYRGDPSWDADDDLDDEYNQLDARFSSHLTDPTSGPRRFRDRDGAPKGDKKPRKTYRQRMTNRRRDGIESDDE